MRIDFDSVWKDTTEVYFPALLELFEFDGLPQLGDHEPLSFLDQEMQTVARILGDDVGLEATANQGDTAAAAVASEGEAQPAHPGDADNAPASKPRTDNGSRRNRRRDRRRAGRSRRLRVDKLVRVPLPRVAGSEGEATEATGAVGPAGSAGGVASGVARAAARASTRATTRAGAKATATAAKSSVRQRPVYWLAHIEVQTQRDPALPRRLFDYHYHIERQHRCRVITFVILGDLSQSWRPDRFSSDIPPLGMGLGYVAIKLLDIEKKLEDPKFRGNPVAIVVRAHLAALRTRRDLEARYTQRVARHRRAN